MTERDPSCRQCGAQLEYQPGEQAVKCGYCGTVTEIPQPTEQLPETPKWIIPLSVDREALLNAVQTYMASGEFTPDDLLDQAQIRTLEFSYVPAYLYSGDYEAEWTASFGYAREEHYTEYEEVTHYSNGRSWTERVPRTRTRIVYDWRPAHGRDSGKFAVLGFAGTGSPQYLDLLRRANGITGLTSFDPSYVAGIDTVAFAASGEAVYARSASPEINEIVEAGVRAHAQGDRQQDWHWTANTSYRTDATLVPIGHVMFEYRGKAYHFWADGNDASSYLAEPLPVDESKKPAINRGYLPAVITAASIPLAGLALGDGWLDGFSILAAVGLGFALLYAALRKSSIMGHSKALREAALARKRGDRANTLYLSDADRASLARSYERPEPPLLARTSSDAVVLPLLSLVAASSVAIPLLIDRVPATYDRPYQGGQSQWNRPSSTTSVAAAPPTNAAPGVAEALPKPSPAAAEQALVEALRMRDWSTFTRAGDIGHAIAGYVALGHIAPTADQRLDYTDYYFLRQLTSFLGHGLIAIEHEYMAEWVGCCVDAGAAVLLSVAGDTSSLIKFARANGCTFEDHVDATNEYEGIPRGHYARMSCRDNDALAVAEGRQKQTASAATDPAPPSVAAVAHAPIAAPIATGASGPCSTLTTCTATMLAAGQRRDGGTALAVARAIEAMRKPERGDRRLARALNDEGLTAFRARNYAVSTTKFAEASAADPGDEEVFNNLIFSLSEQGNHSAAERILPSAILLNPRRANVWANIAVSKYSLGKTDEALGAMWLAHEFSTDRARLVSLIERLESTHHDPRIRRFYALTADWLGLRPTPEKQLTSQPVPTQALRSAAPVSSQRSIDP